MPSSRRAMSLLSVFEGTSRFAQVSKDGRCFLWSNGTRQALPVRLPAQALVSASTIKDDLLVLGLTNGGVIIVFLGEEGGQVDLQVERVPVSALLVTEIAATRRLFVATSEGQLTEFTRNAKDGAWNTSPRLVKDGLGNVTAMAAHQHFLYVAAKDGTRVKLIDSTNGGLSLLTFMFITSVCSIS